MSTLSARDFTWTPLDRTTPTLRVTLEVASGERVLLAGTSGAGKSTLLRGFAGVLDDVVPGTGSGELLIDGRPPSAGDGRVGLVSQNPLDATVAATVGRDVAFGLENLAVPRDDMPARVAAALASIGFPYPPEHPTNALSGGQAQRLALAGVLTMSPQVVLLDEPVSMLDAPSAAELRAAISASLDGVTLVVADHDIEGWLGLVDRLVVLGDGGAVVADGPIADVLATHRDALLDLGIWVPGVEPPAVPCTPTPDDDPALVADGLVVTRRAATGLRVARSRPHLALDGVGTALHPGQFLALRGPSGSGKSTLLGALSGAFPLAAGTLTWRGEPTTPARWPSRLLAERVGWVPQFAEATAVGGTVRESLLATCRALGADEASSGERADALLASVGLSEHAGRHPLRLSGGEQRRLAVATALAHEPPVLLLDEPTVGLDRHTWARVASLIAAARNAGVAVVASTHDRHLVALADRQQHLPLVPRPDDAVPEQPRGLLGRSGPLSLLAGLVLLIVGGLVVDDLAALGIGVAAVIVVLGALTGGRFPWLRLIPAALAVASVTWSNWLLSADHSLVGAATAGARVAFLAIPGIVIASYLDPGTLGDHLGQRLRLPQRPVAAMAAALHRLETMGEQWAGLRHARRVRGLEPSRSPLARARYGVGMMTTLLVDAIRGAGRLTAAMQTRGFSAPVCTGRPRTWAVVAAWTIADTAMLGVLAALATTPIVAAWWF